MHYMKPLALIYALTALACSPSLAQDNGIAVGKPKIFDNRSLTIMMDQLNASLANTMFIDPSSLAAALSFYRSTEVQSVYRSLSVGSWNRRAHYFVVLQDF